jgi:hypothetical protein
MKTEKNLLGIGLDHSCNATFWAHTIGKLTANAAITTNMFILKTIFPNIFVSKHYIQFESYLILISVMSVNKSFLLTPIRSLRYLDEKK